MQDVFSIIFDYHKVHPTTWMYLSSLLTIGLYVKFSRVWSVRNFDLLLLIMFAPGLLLEFSSHSADLSPAVAESRAFAGYIWLFTVSAIFLFRMLADSTMVRRPLLEPNLSVGGMMFLGISLMLFLMANVLNSDSEDLNIRPTTVEVADTEVTDTDATETEPTTDDAAEQPSALRLEGPGYPLLDLLPNFATQTFGGQGESTGSSKIHKEAKSDAVKVAVARTLAILSHLAIVAGLVSVGYRHFDNTKTGIAAAVLYLLLPYTAAKTGYIAHVLPAAMLVWGVFFYRRPLVSGLFIGMAMCVIYYPLFLLPLWISFYWHRGLMRFIGGVGIACVVAVSLVALDPDQAGGLWAGVQRMFGIATPALSHLQGFWGFDGIHPEYRLPLLALCIALSGSLALWPAQKNLGTLMSCSAAIMVAVQFWHGHGGGLFMAWYLPLMLLTIFRPNLEDRVALSVLGEGWSPRRRTPLLGRGRAA